MPAVSSSSPRTYLYKLTSDRGGAPCAPPPGAGKAPLLSLSICKPAIRRTAQVGDRILGLTSRALVEREGYPPDAILYAAVVTSAVDARIYYAPGSRFRSRPDCIYKFHRENGTLSHAGRSPLHAEEAYLARDIGRYPYYRNGRTLLSDNFRYLGQEAFSLSQLHPQIFEASRHLGQGHRVYLAQSPEAAEVDNILDTLWNVPTRYTPSHVTSEAYGHRPPAGKLQRNGSEAYLRRVRRPDGSS